MLMFAVVVFLFEITQPWTVLSTGVL